MLPDSSLLEGQSIRLSSAAAGSQGSEAVIPWKNKGTVHANRPQIRDQSPRRQSVSILQFRSKQTHRELEKPSSSENSQHRRGRTSTFGLGERVKRSGIQAKLERVESRRSTDVQRGRQEHRQGPRLIVAHFRGDDARTKWR